VGPRLCKQGALLLGDSRQRCSADSRQRRSADSRSPTALFGKSPALPTRQNLPQITEVTFGPARAMTSKPL
jgi:hypothetical protein